MLISFVCDFACVCVCVCARALGSGTIRIPRAGGAGHGAELVRDWL